MPTARLSAPTPRCLLPRNVYHTRRRLYGQWGYFAVTSDGTLIGPYRARHYEDDAEIVAMLLYELDALDPVVIPRHLALVKPDGPIASVGLHRYRSWLLGARASLRRPRERAASGPR